MSNQPIFEQQIQSMIAKAEGERLALRARYERELQQALQAIDQRIEHYVCTLNDYRADNGLPVGRVASPAEEELIGELKKATYRTMLFIWADAHDGQIVMRDLIHVVTDVGIFDKLTKAHRSLYSAMSTAKKRGEFEWVEQGIYQRKPQLLTTEKRAETLVEAEAFREQHKLPHADESSPLLYIEADMAPRRQAM